MYCAAFNVLGQTRPIYNVINISFYSVHPFQGASFFYLKFILSSTVAIIYGETSFSCSVQGLLMVY